MRKRKDVKRMDLKKASIQIALALFLTSISFNVIPTIAQAPPIMSTFKVEPASSTGAVGESITLAVNVYDAQDLWGWQVYMTWDPTVLGFTDFTFGDFLASQPEGTSQMKQVDYVSDGWLMGTESTFGQYSGVTADSGWLMSVDFEVVGEGETTIDISSSFTYWMDSTLEAYGDEPGEMIKENGYFSTGPGPAQPPVASFTFSPASPAVGDTVTFDASGSSDPDGTIVSWDWDFGDGATDSGEIVTHSYSTADTYTVTLTVTDNDALTDTATDEVTVLPGPPPATMMYVDPSTVTANPNEYFTINVSIADVTDLYSWGFKLGWPRGLLEASTENITEGPFLKQGGTTAFAKKVYTNYIDVGCSFLGANPGVSGSGTLATVTLKVLKTGNATLDLYSTTLLDPTLTEIAHLAQDGYFYTTWPVADFSYSPNPLDNPGHPIVGEDMTFDGSSSYDPDGGVIVSYEWTFGDGTSDTGQTVMHSYDAAGSYQVTLTVTDDEGETYDSSQSILVHEAPGPPIMSTFKVEPATSTGAVGESVTLSVNVYDAQDLWGWQVYMSWDPTVLGFTALTFGDFLASQPEGSVQVEQLDYVSDGWLMCAESTLGQYSGVTADSGWLMSVEFEILAIGETTIDVDSMYTFWQDSTFEVYGDEPGEMIKENGYFSTGAAQPPVASFTFSPVEPQVNETVVFDASASYDPDGAIVSYEWDFGDGSTGTGMIITHLYGMAGTYAVTLTIVDNDGLTSTATAVVTVRRAVHDVAVTYVNVYPTIVISGQNVYIDVYVTNEGTVSETFDVTVYYDTSVIGTSTVWDLQPGTSYWLGFSWNTAGVAEGSYTISVEASVVPGETDTADNTYVDGVVTVSVPRIAITPHSGPTGTKITVTGSGFPTGMSGYLMFDDQLVGFIFADADGSFNATFNVPVSEAGQHMVKAIIPFYTYPLTLEEAFTVVDTTPLSVDADVGALYFKGETAEFHVQTSFKGVAVDVTSINVTLYKPDDTTETLTAQRTATGFYTIEYAIKGKGSMLGTYTLVVEASYISATVNSTGTTLRTFIVKSPWREWEREAPKVALSIATVASAIGLFIIWRREDQK